MARSAGFVDFSANAFYIFVYTTLYAFLSVLFQWSIEGHEHIPKDKATRILFVGYHTTHNWDLLLTGMSLRDVLDEAPVGIMHRTLVALNPWLRLLGAIQGTRQNVLEMYNRGHRACMVIPGGAEEAVAGFEHAYTVDWKSSSGRVRTGFAELAMDAKCVVVPVVVQNAQEMYFNPLFYLVNVTGLSRAYDHLLALPYGVGWVFLQLKLALWMTLTFPTSIPMPVKATLKVGKALRPRKAESPAVFARRVETAYRQFLHRENPGGLDYTRAVQARLAPSRQPK
ncbi:hypothetical protein SDRG_02378 [Saprolegnia diclina VS20]|uniref:Phospholipid/glycerol acyltransferase domain-containing protein n=1 Tax=Saprolegnia diclina (strain VS20) TaxID=1156394 RepID=T0R0N2_SAPDV|nr:hypothetical protein SDRG_02378 [Saprolegnia diclina VS20]EQC40486.1 hypothetical protein SDRG_02378 [Saprolegnia diclina VS20]|eukprot:XP_008606185.1 hypothetical protein SDRG_02378 [Saprolegnia diclina VS20]